MKTRLFAFIALLYLLTLLQVSFLSRFSFFDGPIVQFFGPVFLAVVLANLLEKQKSGTGLAAAAFGGFFLDMQSERFFGFWMAILLATAYLIKYLLKRYVRIPAFR